MEKTKITKKMMDEFNYLMRQWLRSSVDLKELLKTTRNKELKDHVQNKIKETLGKLKEKNTYAMKLKADIQGQLTYETYVEAVKCFMDVMKAKFEAQERVWKEKQEFMTNQLENKDVRIRELYDLIACMGRKIGKLQTCADVFV